MLQIRVTSPAISANVTSWQLLWDDVDWQQPGAKTSLLSHVGLPMLLKLLPSIPAAFMGGIRVKQSGVNDKSDPDQPAVFAGILSYSSSAPC